MPMFEIEQYELHAQRFLVEATSEAQAIQKLLAGQAEPMDGGPDLIEVCDDRGMAVAENRKLAADLRALGVKVGKKVIPSIRSIEQVW
jgi:hypothetical protein